MKTDDILAVALDKDTHKEITKAFREEIGYAYEIFNSKTTIFSDAQDVWNEIVNVYTKTNNESYIPLLKEYLINNASKNALSNILDWGGY